MTLTITAGEDIFPIAGEFRIARGARTEAKVVRCTISDGSITGQGECLPYARYNESVEGVIADIKAVQLSGDTTPEQLLSLMPAGAARNAVDAALLDFRAKRDGVSVANLYGFDQLKAVETAYTLSINSPEKMGEAAKAANRPLLKIKVGDGQGDEDLDRIRAVRAGAPDARMIVDANEGWTADQLRAWMPVLADMNITLIEQPLPAGKDEALAGIDRLVPICADESCHDSTSLDHIIGKYDFINIKMDKTGGLTEAMKLAKLARDANLNIMVGCMLASSLAMAPAFYVAQIADVVDLDGPLLLAEDRPHAIHYEGSMMQAPTPALWG